MRISRKRFINFIANAIVFVLAFSLLITGIFLGWFDNNKNLLIAMIAICTFYAAFVTFSIFIFFNDFTLLKTLHVENEYNFGVRSNFNNLYAFTKRVEMKQKTFRKKGKSQHMIAFTFSNLLISQNVNRNKEIHLLNNHIASFLNSVYLKVNSKKKNFVYAFSRGTFMVYAHDQTVQKIQEICEIITREIYHFAEDNCHHVWVQPFYGIFIIKKEAVTNQIENAMLARDNSERNFETITFYQDSFRKVVSASDIEEMTQALKEKEFVVYYQPKFNLSTKKFNSAEALIRWNSKKYGLLAPKLFLNKAEAVGLIHDIDIYVLRQVCEDLNELIRRGRRVLPISVNFFLYEFYSSNFLDVVMDILREFKIPVELIQIEITEAASQANQFLSISIIKKLKNKGIKVLMDDFGIGYSNVGNLKKIPFDAVKIDKSFIDDIVGNTKAREIVRFLIGLCKINGMEVIAEGVDSKEQVDILKRIKCDTIQGFYYSKALPKKEFEVFLSDNPFEKKERAKK
ncbi:MAG: EAL domain-containing protein [Erysipelotrichaceae bacterium]|jgi:EAL domain-containing protein (putative c-di-GMP-specific phosphodiesterase class I)|nr:EAL domain-containing protein [Erysipelotrichaceae bacterium]